MNEAVAFTLGEDATRLTAIGVQPTGAGIVSPPAPASTTNGKTAAAPVSVWCFEAAARVGAVRP